LNILILKIPNENGEDPRGGFQKKKKRHFSPLVDGTCHPI
jgi:hypothetical protein